MDETLKIIMIMKKQKFKDKQLNGKYNFIDTKDKLISDIWFDDVDEYIVIEWPAIQDIMDRPGFKEHSYLINDEKGIKDFGSSAYFVNKDWLLGAQFDFIDL